MASANRYSLVHVSEEGIVTPLTICFDVDGKIVKKSKFPLSQLDAFTTRLGGVDDVYCAFKILSGKDLELGNFYIQYRQDMEDKRIRVAYFDDFNLKCISNNNICDSFVSQDLQFETYVFNLLNDLRNDSYLFRFLVKSDEKYLNSYVLRQINNYFTSVSSGCEDNIKFYFKKVCLALSSYKVIRNIEDGRRKYREKHNDSPYTFKVLSYGVDEDGQSFLF